MSVVVKDVEWTLLGEIPTGQQMSSLRLFSSAANSSSFSYTRNGSYKVYNFLVSGSNISSNNFFTYNIPQSGNPPAFSTGSAGSDFSYYFNGEIKHLESNQLYTIIQEGTTSNPFGSNTITIYGFDAIDISGSIGYTAYSFQDQGTVNGVPFNNKYLRWGKFNTLDQDLNPWILVNTGITGEVRLSRNGLFCCIFEKTGTSRIIRVYTPQSGSFPNSGSATSIKVGNDIVITGDLDVRINNAGTRLLVSSETYKSIYYYELISGQWILQDTITPQLIGIENIYKFSINSDASIFVALSTSGFFTYTLSGTSWFGGEKVVISNDSEIDLSLNSVFLGVNSQNGVSIYKSTITEITYDAPVIIPGQSFTIAQNRAFSETVAVLNDGLNREITEWSAIDLPSGLTINSTTGQITGSISTEGSFSSYITASGPGGSSTEMVDFYVFNSFPFYKGSSQGESVYAGSTEGNAIYYGNNLIWNVDGWQSNSN